MKCISAILMGLVLSPLAQASIYASPSSVNFGSVEVGRSSFRTVSFYNNGDQDVSVNFSNCFGDIDASTFSCRSIRAHGSCSVSVTFRPRNAGGSNCSLRANVVQGGSGSAYVSISGRGVRDLHFEELEDAND